MKAMPRLKLITCKTTSHFKKQASAEPPVTKSGAAAGMQLKGLLCTDRNKDGSGLLMKPVQREESDYMNSIAATHSTLYEMLKSRTYCGMTNRDATKST